MRCVTDANIWIDLDEGGLLGRVFDLGDDLSIPDLIFAELRTPDTSLLEELGLKIVGLSGFQLADVQANLARRYPKPSVVDLTALVVARDQDLVLLTGDGALREAGEAEGVEVHGVLWLLDRMVGEGVLAPPEAARSLRLVMSAGARLPRKEVGKRLKAWSAPER